MAGLWIKKYKALFGNNSLFVCHCEIVNTVVLYLYRHTDSWNFNITMWKVIVKVAQLCPTLYSPWKSPGQNAGVSRCSLLQGIFPTQESNRGHLHCKWILYQLSYEKSLKIFLWAPFFLGVGQEYWSGLPFPSPGDVPDPGIEPRSPAP